MGRRGRRLGGEGEQKRKKIGDRKRGHLGECVWRWNNGAKYRRRARVRILKRLADCFIQGHIRIIGQ
jgi:hypothetical protein